jgi:hypothetical protein
MAVDNKFFRGVFWGLVFSAPFWCLVAVVVARLAGG